VSKYASHRVVIIGGGPAGLTASIAAKFSGIECVIVVEKRRSYSRHIWFDLYGLPLYRARKHLFECLFRFSVSSS